MIKNFLDKYREDFDNCKEDLKDIKTWYRQIPNLLTISRPIGMIPANILFFTGNVISAVILTGCLLITDFFDGKLARKWDVQSKLGADLDAVGDKIMFLGLSLPLLVNYPSMIINFLGEAMIALVNTNGVIKGFDMKTVFSGKVKTWFLSITLVMGYLVQFFNAPISVLRGLTIITAISQGIALKDYINEYNKMNKEKANVLEEDNNICENLILEQDNTLLEQLKREREFLLATLEPGKVYTGKRRVRILLQEKKNNG